MGLEPRESFNLTKFKGRARRAASRDSAGSATRFNPFRRIEYHAPKRSSTAGDAELGREGKPADVAGPHGQHVPHASTAPVGPESPTLAFSESKDQLPESAPTTRQSTGTNARQQEQLPGAAAAGDQASGVRKRRPQNPAPAPVLAREGKDAKKEKSAKAGLIRHVYPKEPFTVRNQLQRTLLGSWINVLLCATPAGIALNYIGVDGRVIFAVNFIAIIPLAAMLGFATEEIALRTGETIGGLINATFGNAVELIVAVLALVDGKVDIVQTSLVGSILSNLLLVLGMCFFCGGVNRPKQKFNTVVAQTATSLLALAAASVIVPTVFSQNASRNTSDDASIDHQHVAALSRGVAVILLVVYGAYLLFQLKTHSEVLNEVSEKTEARPLFRRSPQEDEHDVRGVSAIARAGGGLGIHGDAAGDDGNRVLAHMPRRPREVRGVDGDVDNDDDDDDDDDDDEEEPQLSFAVAVATLALSTALIGVCAEFMVDSIDALTAGGAISEEFVGLIMLPIVGNAAEHFSAVSVAIKDKMDLAIGVAVGSSMQVALFLIPLLVVIGWIMGNENMTLAFDTFQVATMFVSVLLVNYLIADGESHWLEGFLLINLYMIVAVCSWWYPTPTESAG